MRRRHGRVVPALLALGCGLAAGCGDDAGGDGGDGAPPGGDGPGGVVVDGGRNPIDARGGDQMFVNADDLENGTGCDGPFNADQVLTYRITTSSWTQIANDATAEVYYPGTFACGDEPPIQVGIRRRRSGAADKFGVKIDANWAVAGQTWRSLKQINFDVGSGAFEATSLSGLVSEYAAWRVHRLAGHKVSRSAMARLEVNGEDHGVFSNVEDVDKRFLFSRLGDDSGWLYKISGAADDGYRTNETLANPYEAQWCIFENNPCPAPADLETWLPARLAIEQMLILGAVNTAIGNPDGPIAKRNNFYSYDYAAGPRHYFPWDLDTAFTRSVEPFPSAMRSEYQDILFTYWEDDYDALFTALMAGPLSVASVHAELDRVVAVAGAAIDADPILDGSAAGIVGGLKSWYATRHAEVVAALEAHP